MRALLSAVKTSLPALTVEELPVTTYITPDEMWKPAGVKFPCLGIMPGGSAPEELICGLSDIYANVRLVAFVRMGDDGEAAIVGDTGVLAVLDAASTILLAGWAAIDGCQGTEIIKDEPSELIETDNAQWIVKIVRTMRYVVQR